MKTESFYRLILVAIIIIFAVLTVSIYLPFGLNNAPGNTKSHTPINNSNYTRANIPIGLLSAIPKNTLNTIILPDGVVFQPEVGYSYPQNLPQTSLMYIENITATMDMNTICDAYPALPQCTGINDTLYNLISKEENINISYIPVLFNESRYEINTLYEFVHENNLSKDKIYAPIVHDANLINVNTTNSSDMLRVLVNLKQVAGIILNKSDYISYFNISAQNLSNTSIIQLINFVPPFEMPFYLSPFIQNRTGIVDLISNQSEFNDAVYRLIISYLGQDVSTVCLINQDNACNVNEMKALNSSEYAEI
ncbi:MAG: hypothetical protein ACP5RE_01265 [Candidatus Acidifodinimicrobium sp.]